MEFVHSHKKSIVNQREVALKNADSPNNLRLSLSLNTDKVEKKAAPASLSLIEKEEHKDEEDALAVQI